MITTNQIIAAIQARLVADAAIIALVPAAKIGNYLVQDVGYPHIKYMLQFETLPVKGEDAQSVNLQFDIWTEYSGSKKCMDIADAIRAELDQAPITIASGDCFGLFYRTMDNFQEPEGKLYRCTMLFQLLIGD